MFGLLKKKFSEIKNKILNKVKEEAEIEEIKIEKSEVHDDFKSDKYREEAVKTVETETVKSEEKAKDKVEGVADIKESDSKNKGKIKKKVGIKEKIIAVFKREVVLDEKKLDELLYDIQIDLLESDVALETAEKILNDLKKSLYGKSFKKSVDIENIIKESLKKSLNEIIPENKDLIEIIKESGKKPFVILFVGVNGSGKTTTIAKIANLLKKNNISCVIAASDTFRAGAIEQLEKHARNVGIKVIKHKKGADPAAVAYDAIEHAKARGIDVVLIDTAGRMETNVDLLNEMKKIARVAKPDMILIVVDALTGNAALDQAVEFNNAVELSGVILTKVDADAKGGAALSIAHAIKKPIYYLGTGQNYDDIVLFNKKQFIESLVGE